MIVKLNARSTRSAYDLPGSITYAVMAGVLLGFACDVEGRLARSHAAKQAFQRENVCPATLAPRGSCPGWQIDHIVPLKCNGFDTPANMQWLTIAAHAAKTRREILICRKHPM